ncbi:LPS-assembly protein LptD [Loktanella sp. D2R18]|uniref:LPS-assembly protein LptD n=1 Tax=Rhodobacterales TaxID=204455 RepID=UPI000DE86029|nr:MULTISPECIES: LPS assembly protein LptD [Rhodobacterales]MDO6589625.1 LPS assembly protein LptD [Yoonia sp. 1_MG-2023]RBW44260.1 LPS-assembly protein LptD [Loktanella sp. D2R18]
MRLITFLLLLLLPQTSLAQGAATLVADSVRVTDDQQLIATGNIEVLYEGTRLTATEITYDPAGDRLTVTGPIVIQTSDGTLLMAQSGALDPTLENGILQGARIVLDQQLQLVANQIDRHDGRYWQLYKTVATSCQVCGDAAPLWSIRAQRVVHDSVEQQLYLDNATLLIRDIPVFWLPTLRLPDPNLERATGFLIPEQRNNTQLGTGIKVPYFITLGDSRDLTVTPYVSEETRTLELIYRQAFRKGSLRIEGAASDDTLEDEDRSYIFASGSFDLSRDYKLDFDVEAVSDTAYLEDYSYSSKDRLDSEVSVTRVTDTALTQVALTYYQTLRDDETNSSLPPIVANALYEARDTERWGGTLTYGASIDSAYRYNTTDGDDGRDVSRIGAYSTWDDSWILGSGIVLRAETGIRADYYNVQDDSSYDSDIFRAVPSAQITVRWPLAADNDGGAAHLITPVLSLGWAESYGETPPNEDSTRSELDQGNLLDLSRFTGEDAVETGAQVALGVSYTRIGTAGLDTSLAFGRVLRETENTAFTSSSGLDGLQSDWLVAGQISSPGGFLFDARALFDDNTGLTVADGRIAWKNDRVSLAANYIWQSEDADEDLTDTVSAWTVDAGVVLSDAWRVDLDGRYDIAADSPVSAGIELGWQNECVNINVSASRSYTSSSTVDPSTTFGLSGSLTGFSAGRSAAGTVASCRN